MGKFNEQVIEKLDKHKRLNKNKVVGGKDTSYQSKTEHCRMKGHYIRLNAHESNKQACVYKLNNTVDT